MIKIAINNKTVINQIPNHTLLDSMEKQSVIIESQCRNGNCGTCRCVLLSGEVSYDEPPLAFLAPNEILPCVCRADSDLKLEQVNIQKIAFNKGA